MENGYAFADALETSQRINWHLDDVMGPGRTLDFGRPFMPEALARTRELTFLSPREQRVLNQIRGNTYLGMFGLCEEFILPFVLDHARPRLSGDDARVRALLQFAGEEAKHIELFKRFQVAFRAGFGTDCGLIGPASDVAREVLAHHPLAVALAVLQIEWMTQAHYLESVRDDGGLDPQFKSLLRHHWMEEAQHARIDTLIVEALAAACTPEELDRAVEEYLEIGGFIDGGLEQQLALDLDAFERATGRVLGAVEREHAERVQRQANRFTYLGSGMTHPKFRATLRALGPAYEARVAAVAPAFC